MTAAAIAAPLEVLTLSLQGETFALDAAIVHEILDWVPITEVPNARPFVGGLLNVRGKVVPFADLRVSFGMERPERTQDTRIVVIGVPLAGEPTLVGILAEKVFEVTTLLPAALEEPPPIGMRWNPEFIRAIGKRGDDFIIVLAIDRVFAAQEAASRH
ncbi:chemotaxis protein CheW [mine drainage metagenome]|uniref:Chemotaxis protein CheW n=1 Tax=mine drainage metagenome TaxID=410659 RepID=A0A1J5S4W8_9ZZZZ